MGLGRFRTQFDFKAPEESYSIRFSQPILLEYFPDPKGPALSQTTARVRVIGLGRELDPSVDESFEVEAYDIDEEGEYRGRVHFTLLAEGNAPKRGSFPIKVEAIRPKDFTLASNSIFQATRCSACWLRDMILPSDQSGPQRILLEFRGPDKELHRYKDLHRYIEYLKVDITPEKGYRALPPSALNWPRLTREETQALIALNIDPNALSPGTYENRVQLLLPNGSLLTESADSKLTIKIRQGPGILLGLILLGVLLYIISAALWSQSSLTTRLADEVFKHIVSLLGTNSLTTPSIQESRKSNLEQLQGRWANMFKGTPPQPTDTVRTPRQLQRDLVLLRCLADTVARLRQVQDSMLKHNDIYPAKQRQQAIGQIDATCQALTEEHSPASVARSIEVLRERIANLEKQALEDNANLRSTELAFIINRLQVIANEARGSIQSLPIPWLNLSTKDILWSGLCLLAALVVIITVYKMRATFGEDGWAYIVTPLGIAGALWLTPFLRRLNKQ